MLGAYIKEELYHWAIHGQRETNSNTRRTIGWPKGNSVNDFVHKCKYLDTYLTLQYPSIDHITRKFKKIRSDALIYKIDISRAFTHLRTDLGDIDLLGILRNKLYLDGSLPFGFCLGSGFFERYIRYIMKSHGHNAHLN